MTIHVVHPGGTLQCTTYLIAAPHGAVLVDPGSGYAEADVLAGIARAGLDPARITHALLTHCHVDHARGAFRFRERGVALVAAPATAEILRTGGHQVWYEFPDHVVPTEIDLEPADGQTLDLGGLAITVVHTPGHTPGCTSYLVETPDGLAAFTGDLIMGSGQPGWAGSEGFSAEASLASIEKLLALRPARAFTGHGPVAQPAATWLRHARTLARTNAWSLHPELHPNIPPPENVDG